MAGNFSFGDYFKETAIPLAWELMTRPVDDGGYGLAESKLWVTVYDDDDEAHDIWTRDVGVSPDRIQRMGRSSNYWSMGVPGPCGPCSEIFYDLGPEHGPDGGPAVDDERFREIWNLVFMQYERGPGTGKDDFEILGELPAKSIDTGLGMERLAAVLQGVDNIYEIDTSKHILDRASALSGARYGSDELTDVRLRVVADHARTAAMLVGDGVTPGNEGRGYVLRRIMRRTIRTMRLLGAGDRTAGELVAASVEAMSSQYPELLDAQSRITAVSVAEEESFLSTLRSGTTIFDQAVPQARAAGNVLGGDQAFALHDTYGFPIDLTLEMAAEQGLQVDEAGFRTLMAEQRRKAKADAAGRKTGHTDVSAYRDLRESAGASEFTGYFEVSTEATVRGLLRDGARVTSAEEGTEVEVVLDRTPFYAEAGGQVADGGFLEVGGARVEVLDVQRPVPDLVVHRVRVLSGEIVAGDTALALVDIEQRRAISRAHTATHLIHQTVRSLVGEQATQAGSMNAPGRLRFDFASPSAVDPAVLRDVEDRVNEVAMADLEVRAFVTTQDEARKIGAMALFGEKYGDAVRVVEVGDYARELCGGTHAARSGQLGMVKIVSESSIGSGVRRVEALVGLDAFRFLAREQLLVSRLAETFKVPSDQLVERVESVITSLRDAERELAGLRAGAVLQAAAGLAAGALDVHGVAVVAHRAPDGTSGDDLRRLVLDVRGRLDGGRPAVVAIGAVTKDRPSVVVAVNDAGRGQGLAAGALVRLASQVLGGGGGGKDDVAQGGGTRPEALDDALAVVRDAVAEITPA